eukprot:TRINITY_DN10812_c0_g1_i1.p1 TRINITY_DN10812_c0_g1~~TRINITY_DN10812_c0_g1_i1.p1  ORF type:complete len:185 (+),score=40.94 TRINITY_DN10812_c0_g1_i1:54-608(+)
MAAVVDRHEEVPCTYMIQNLPSRWSTEKIKQVIEGCGFEDMLDFFYMPRRERQGKSQSFGYAFINVASPTDAQAFMAAAENGTLLFGTRVANVVPAAIQGVDALKTHFKGKQVMKCLAKPMFLDDMTMQQAMSSHESTPTRSTTFFEDATTKSRSTRMDDGKTFRSSMRWCDTEDEDLFDSCHA